MEDLRSMTTAQLRRFREKLEAENKASAEKDRRVEEMLKRHKKERKAIGL